MKSCEDKRTGIILAIFMDGMDSMDKMDRMDGMGYHTVHLAHTRKIV